MTRIARAGHEARRLVRTARVLSEVGVVGRGVLFATFGTFALGALVIGNLVCGSEKGSPGSGGANAATTGSSSTTAGPAASTSATGGAGGSGGSGSGGAPTDAGFGSDAAPTPSTFKVDGVATWRGNAKAAYSITHDDLCDQSALGSFHAADPELTKRGLHAGFGAIISQCLKNDMLATGNVWPKWDAVKVLVQHGHDVFSHSWNHRCMTNNNSLANACDPSVPKTTDWATEIDQSGTTLAMQTGLPIDFYIFPFDVCDPAAIARLKTDGYIGARCGGAGTVTPADFPDGFKLGFDVFGPANSMYWKTPPCTGITQYETSAAKTSAECRAFVLKQYVDDAIAKGGWGNRELHGFSPADDANGGWETVRVPEYQAHLDYLVTKIASGDLWVEGPSRVLRYRFAREQCGAPTMMGGHTLHFAAPSTGCQRYATTVTYLVSTTDASDPSSLGVQQGGVALPTRKLGPGRFAVDADPTRGDALLTR
jgi:hypothetical protein